MSAPDLVDVVAARPARGQRWRTTVHRAPDTPTGNGFRPICGAQAPGAGYRYASAGDVDRFERCRRCAEREETRTKPRPARTEHGTRVARRRCTAGEGGAPCQECRDAEARYRAEHRARTGAVRRPGLAGGRWVRT